jgi:Sec-independent protein translocase protein TatA
MMSNKRTLSNLKVLIREFVKESLLNEDDKPGGGLTKFGAEYKIERSDAIADAMKALAASDGNAREAAKTLGISIRRMYDYINMSSKLQRAQDKFQDEERKEQESDKKLSKRPDERDTFEDKKS